MKSKKLRDIVLSILSSSIRRGTYKISTKEINTEIKIVSAAQKNR